MTTQQVIKELNSDTKIKIMCWLLKTGSINVSELTTKIQDKTRINISKQISELKKANLVEVYSSGRNNFYTLNKELDPNLIKLIKTIVNTYHIVDEDQKDFIPYK